MNIKLDLPIGDVNKILLVLGKMPYEQVVQMIDSIRTQVAEQTKPPTEPPGA
jgi:hypothetical protein